MNLEIERTESVPARLAMQYTTERAKETLEWLKEIEDKFKERRSTGKDCSKLQKQKRILTDIFSVYISTLVEKKGSGHSIVKSFKPHKFTNEFTSLPIVKKCCLNRNNRSGHESKNYGNFVSPQEIIESDLESWLSEAQYFVCVVGQPK